MVLLKKNWPFLLGLILTLSLLWPLFYAPIFSHHDDIQVIRLHEMNECFKDGQIPCRWVPNLGGSYGYPLFNYYAPLPYYFGELIYLLSHNLIFSVKVMFATSFIGSFIFMYLLSRKFWGSLGGSLSAIFYSFAPYHAVDFYVRGAMGEMWGLMFFPGVLWAYARLSEKPNIARILVSALFVAGLFTSHNLSAMLFTPVILSWILFLFHKKRTINFLWSSLGGAVLGILLAAFYLFPMLAEKEYVHVDTTTYGYFSYTEHFKGFKKLLIERFWGYGGSFREVPGGEKDGMSYQVGWVHLIAWILSIFAAFKIWNKNRNISLLILFCSVWVAFAIFMVNPRALFIWDLLGPLKYIQFPWRFLTLVILFISFAAGGFFVSENSYITKKKMWWGGLVLLVVLLNFAYFKPGMFIYVNDKELLAGENWERQIRRSIYDYLPIFAQEPPAELAKDNYEVLTGDSRVYDFSKGSDWISFKTETQTHTIIRLSQYYFPNWKLWIDGQEARVEYSNNNLGLMTLILGKGPHDVYLKLFDTKIRAFSNLISVGAAAFLILLFIIQLKKVRKWIEYYRKRAY